MGLGVRKMSRAKVKYNIAFAGAKDHPTYLSYFVIYFLKGEMEFAERKGMKQHFFDYVLF